MSTKIKKTSRSIEKKRKIREKKNLNEKISKRDSFRELTNGHPQETPAFCEGHASLVAPSKKNCNICHQKICIQVSEKGIEFEDFDGLGKELCIFCRSKKLIEYSKIQFNEWYNRDNFFWMQ